MRAATNGAGRLMWAAFAAFFVAYTIMAVRLSALTPVWMDEVLTLWTIRLPSSARIYDALLNGAQFSPPVYHWILFYFSKIAGGGYLAMRLPSIAATVLTGLCSFALFRRYLPLAMAMFGSCLMLEILRLYALLIRPYALVTACFAVSILLWDDYKRRSAKWRCALIAFMLALAVSFHIYSLLLIGCVGLMELIHTVRSRSLRLPVWIALGAAAATTLLWLPLIHAQSQYVAGDVFSPAYYGRPSIQKLIGTYMDLGFTGASTLLPVLAVMAAIALAKVFPKLASAPAPSSKATGNFDADFWTIVFVTASLPVIVYLFAAVVTKSYHGRYAPAAAIGISAIVAGSFSSARLLRNSAALILLLMAGLTLTHRPHGMQEVDFSSAFHVVPGDAPIVIADGLQFFALEESAPADFRSRLVFLKVPPGMPIGDPTNQHLAERWKALNPALPIEDVAPFVAAHPKFWVLDSLTSDNSVIGDLVSRRLIELTTQANGVLVYRSSSHPAE